MDGWMLQPGGSSGQELKMLTSLAAPGLVFQVCFPLLAFLWALQSPDSTLTCGARPTGMAEHWGLFLVFLKSYELNYVPFKEAKKVPSEPGMNTNNLMVRIWPKRNFFLQIKK
jgi:hypothetical protein